MSIRVTDANDNAPEWIGAPYRLRLAEVTAPGTRALQAARARDRDQQGPFSTVEYQVLPGPHAVSTVVFNRHEFIKLTFFM